MGLALVCCTDLSPGRVLLVRDRVPAVGCFIIYLDWWCCGFGGVSLLYQYKSRRESCLVGDKVPAVDYLIIFLNGAIMVGLALVCLYGFKSRREFV